MMGFDKIIIISERERERKRVPDACEDRPWNSVDHLYEGLDRIGL